MDDGGVIQIPTLFSHLMKLGRDEAGAVAEAATLAATAGGKSNVSLPLLLTPAPTEKAVLFARDSGRVRWWMKSALEDRHIDAQVVTSATTLALRWLQGRHLYPSLASSPGAMNGISNNAHSQRWRQPISSQQQQQRQRRRRRSVGGSAGLPPLELLSMTCLHLASKYHTQDSVLEDFESCVHRPEVHALGFDISLSMGAVLNASFRANAFSLQTLLCALSGECPVVKACSEWVSLCLVLLLHPYDEDSERETGASPPHGERVLPPALSAAAAPLTPAPGGPTETPGSQAPSSSASAIATPFTPAGASTTTAASQPRSTSTTTGSTAAAVAWSLRNPDDGKSVAPPAPHQQQEGKAGDVRGRFSRATVLALASLVLARRLARAGGPCLPPRVQATMGLGDGDALLLVSEGLRLARRAFETELCDDSHRQQHPPAAAAAAEGGLRGRDFVGGEVLLERKVEGPAASHPSGTTIARSLLEWLTDSEDGRDAPEFAQGLPLSAATVSSSCSPRGKSPSPSGGSVDHDRAPSPGSVTASDGATRRSKRAHTSAYHDARGGSGVSGEEGGPAARKRQRLGSPPGGPNGWDSGSASPCSRAADRGCAAPAEERAGSSTEEYASAADAFPSPPPSTETSPPPRTPSQDAMYSDGATPRSPPSFSAGGASSVSGDTTLSGDRRPRGWGRVLFSAQSSDKMSEATQSPPRTRGPPAALSASSPEERNARWEVLADRVLEALDDRHCGVVDGSSAGADGWCGGRLTPEDEGNGSSSSGFAAEVAPILPDRCPLPRALAGDTVRSSPPGSPPFSPITLPGPPPVFHDLGAHGTPGEQGKEALTSSRVSSTTMVAVVVAVVRRQTELEGVGRRHSQQLQPQQEEE
ncbi:unnamed protein product [Ectocarpus sp. 12 AP-2014]